MLLKGFEKKRMIKRIDGTKEKPISFEEWLNKKGYNKPSSQKIKVQVNANRHGEGTGRMEKRRHTK